MSANHLEVLTKIYADFAKGDIPAVLTAFDPNIDWTECEGFPYGGNYIGPEAVTENVLMKLGTEWEGWSAVPDEYIGSGDRFVALGKYRAKNKATGKDIEAAFAHSWTFRDGRAVKFEQFADSAIVQEALQD